MRTSDVRRVGIVCVAIASVITATRDARADTTIPLDGSVPTGGPDHFFVPFEVPDGIQEIEILHDDKSDTNILDWGVNDPAGWRGWGGGNTENAILNASAASRSYVPGPITKGTWNVVVGKAKIVSSPAVYHIVVTLRTTPTLAPQTVRKPYADATARATDKPGPRYFAGDFHVHSRESGDATPSLDDIGTFAVSRGMDFVEVSDHNVNTQDDYFLDVQSRFPALLFIPGIEYTTYAGHANAIGATKWVDHKIGQPGVTIDGAAQAILDQGAIFSINHPELNLGDLCIGCAWKHDVDPTKVLGVEIETSALSAGSAIFQQPTLAFWESYLDMGLHVVGLGGGDDHHAGKETGNMQSTLGSPTTLVYASELSRAAIMDGVRKGHVVVKTEGPADPMVELTAGDALPGDTLKQRSAALTATITNVGIGTQDVTAHWVHNGTAEDDFPVTSDPYVAERDVAAPPAGEDRWRLEVIIGNKAHTITNHVFLSYDPNGPDPVAAKSAKSSGGCAITNASTTSEEAGGALLLVAGVIVLRARRRKS